MKKYISKFHYLINDLPGFSHVQQVQMACGAGANWVQHRCLTKPEDELIDEINQIAEICDDWGATLIIANHYGLLDRVDAQGVHIDDSDADLASIRKIIGPDKTLGVSAAGADELLKLQSTGVVDYYVYGPFASALNDVSSVHKVLGFNGYRELEKLGIHIPVIAAGGIQPDDVGPLLQTGIDGIAISSAINLAADPAAKLKEFYRKMY
ncbi:thiamine phosphate synthase [Mucilaginibacter sp. P25]|uniref:Thiamine-phosphate pyrophosphorylase n=1 Tax=Mucilaginibacter gossypii TaxID=551996 RepID=A0A1G8ERE6_9SPHI|nr:thiamine phosphate synthase [Mucilaginibacter gossypii]SDH72387.1 thiamine-phosphate pyrophosphorylase [Mucilaginibacter gossypii]